MTVEAYNELINRVKDYPIGTGVALINTKKSNTKIMNTLVRDLSNCGVDVTDAETREFKQIKNLKDAEQYLKSKGMFGTPIAYAIILLTPRDHIYSKVVYNNLE